MLSDLAAGAMLFVISHEIIPETHIDEDMKTGLQVDLQLAF